MFRLSGDRPFAILWLMSSFASGVWDITKSEMGKGENDKSNTHLEAEVLEALYRHGQAPEVGGEARTPRILLIHGNQSHVRGAGAYRKFSFFTLETATAETVLTRK